MKWNIFKLFREPDRFSPDMVALKHSVMAERKLKELKLKEEEATYKQLRKAFCNANATLIKDYFNNKMIEGVKQGKSGIRLWMYGTQVPGGSNDTFSCGRLYYDLLKSLTISYFKDINYSTKYIYLDIVECELGSFLVREGYKIQWEISTNTIRMEHDYYLKIKLP